MRLTPKDLEVKNPDFTYRNNDCMALELEVQVSEPGDKLSGYATITFRTNQISGYDMCLMVQTGHKDEWQGPFEVGAVSLQIRGEYEREILVAALQKIGLMTLPVYGKIDRGPFEPDEEYENALRQQTPPV